MSIQCDICGRPGSYQSATAKVIRVALQEFVRKGYSASFQCRSPFIDSSDADWHVCGTCVSYFDLEQCFAKPSQTDYKAKAAQAKAANPSLDTEKVQKMFASAARDRNLGLLQQMLELGADPTVKNPLGMTALHTAAANGWKDVVEVLIARACPKR